MEPCEKEVPEDAEESFKHAPVVEVKSLVKPGKKFNVSVKVGQNHPMDEEHFIQWVELYASGVFLGRAEFSPETTKPETSFTLILENPSKLQVVACCNKHGVWEKTLDLSKHMEPPRKVD